MKENYVINLIVRNAQIEISYKYLKGNLTCEDISMGYWPDDEITKGDIFKPIIINDSWYLLLEGMLYWVNDDFDNSFPLLLKRNLIEYSPDILWDPLVYTELTIIIDRVRVQSIFDF